METEFILAWFPALNLPFIFQRLIISYNKFIFKEVQLRFSFELSNNKNSSYIKIIFLDFCNQNVYNNQTHGVSCFAGEGPGLQNK